MSDSVTNWDDIADWWQNEVATDPVYADDIAPMLERLLARPVGPIVELGCGDGQWLRWLGADHGLSIGCDRSEDLLREAGATHAAVACRLPDLAWVRTGILGTAFSVFVLDLIEDEVAFFAEVLRVVRPGGQLVVIINHPIFTAPGSGPFMDPDLDVFWRWGDYLAPGASDVPAGGRSVTMYHRSLGDLLGTAARAGWLLEEVLEAPLGAAAIEREPSYLGQESIPRFLGLRWRR
jgi:SAM-dependent methyltransferase